MSVIDRLNRLVRANLNDLASRAAGRQVMGEVRGSLREARTQLVECRLAEKRLVAEYEDLLDQSLAWEERALLALKHNDEPLARRALERKHGVDRRLRSVKEQLDSQRAYMTDLGRSLDAIEVKLQALRDRGQAESAQKSSPSPVPPPKSGPGATPTPRPDLAGLEAEAELGALGDGEIFEAFDEMGARLSRAEAELDALRELGGSPPHWESEDDLEARFRQLETDRSLRELKRDQDDLNTLRRRLDEE